MSKYRAKPIVIDDIRFASQAEGRRYVKLKEMEREGKIRDLELQPKFIIDVNDQKICTYIADFDYTNKDGAYTVEDVKGFKTSIYRLKKKLVEAIYGIEITEVK